MAPRLMAVIAVRRLGSSPSPFLLEPREFLISRQPTPQDGRLTPTSIPIFQEFLLVLSIGGVRFRNGEFHISPVTTAAAGCVAPARPCPGPAWPGPGPGRAGPGPGPGRAGDPEEFN